MWVVVMMWGFVAYVPYVSSTYMYLKWRKMVLRKNQNSLTAHINEVERSKCRMKAINYLRKRSENERKK